MRWFKHYADARLSDSLSELIRIGGLEAYARYWILLEFLCEKYDGETHQFRFPREEIRSLLRLRSWNGLETFADHSRNVRGMEAKCSGNVFEIYAPILLELQARDFKKARSGRGSSAPKIKSKIKNNNYCSKRTSRLNGEQLDAVYQKYPRKQGKQAGMKKLKTILKTEEDLARFDKAVTKFCEVMAKENRSKEMIPLFSTFVNSQWEDYLDEDVGTTIDFEEQRQKANSKREEECIL